MMLRFSVSGMPETKGSWRPVGRRKTGGVRLIPDNPAEAAWAESVAWAARAALQRPPAPDRQRYQVALDFTLRPPPNGRRTNRRDADKLARSVLDALTGLIWRDDEQVRRLLVDVGVTGEDGRGPPGLHAVIAPWEPGLASVTTLI